MNMEYYKILVLYIIGDKAYYEREQRYSQDNVTYLRVLSNSYR